MSNVQGIYDTEDEGELQPLPAPKEEISRPGSTTMGIGDMSNSRTPTPIGESEGESGVYLQALTLHLPTNFQSTRPASQVQNSTAGGARSVTTQDKLDAFGSDDSVIAQHFNRQGLPGRETPVQWALVASNQYPLHTSREHREGVWSLSTRRQQINAKKCMERDQWKTNKKIETDLWEHRMESDEAGLADPQHRRYLSLLFEPLQNMTDKMYEYLSKALNVENRATTTQNAGVFRGTLFSSRLSIAVNKLGHKSEDFRGTLNPAAAEKDAAGPSSGGSGAGVKLSNQQHVQLLSVFQRYVVRLNGVFGRPELMRRSTWFKFLHHCGLLGPDGGASFSEAARVFAQHVDPWAVPPSLTFIGWHHATMRLLRGPRKSCEHDSTIVATLFNVYLKRCEERLQAALAEARQPIKPRGPSKNGRRAMEPGQTQHNKLEVVAGDDKLNWHLAVGEELMCEPEVMQLLQAHDEPLKLLFAWFVRRERERQRAGAQPSKEPPKEEDDDLPDVNVAIAWGRTVTCDTALMRTPECRVPRSLEDFGRGNLAPRRRSADVDSLFVVKKKNEAFLTVDRRPLIGSKKPRFRVMSGEFDFSLGEDAFREMLSDLGFFPDIVQSYALRQHLRVSAKRRAGGGEKLDFIGFLECLCRISFVFLHFYGNPAQQASSSKAKCLWLLAALRVRCRDLGPALGLPDELVGSTANGSVLWSIHPVAETEMDKIRLQDLVFWDSLDANLPAPTMQKEVRPRSSRKRSM